MIPMFAMHHIERRPHRIAVHLDPGCSGHVAAFHDCGKHQRFHLIRIQKRSRRHAQKCTQAVHRTVERHLGPDHPVDIRIDAGLDTGIAEQRCQIICHACRNRVVSSGTELGDMRPMRAHHTRGLYVAWCHGGAVDHPIHRHELSRHRRIAKPVLYGDKPGLRPNHRHRSL